MSEDKQVVAGRYELDELIGQGGMGDVYRGMDTQTGTPVAIKLLHEHITKQNPDIVDRFQREGEALRQLDHPNIVQILDTIEEDGRHYIIMEYVSGGSLRDLIDEESRLPVDAVLNVALDLADALTRAHRLNIIHRDIKPDNVLLAEDGTPRLTDFGVAHLGDRTRLTETGSVIGTYAYLSPEACNGLELDERTDIWSFGVMLFEMLTGRVPFQEASTAAILTAILTKPAPDLERLRPGVPPALVDLITNMLEKDRDRRISSVRLIGAELEAIIRGMDTPLRNLIGRGPGEVEHSRFATPSEEGGIPAMVRSGAPGQTHGLTVYPSGQPSRAMPGMPTGETVAQTGTKWKWIALMGSIAAIACAVVLVVAILFGPSDKDDESSELEVLTVEAVEPGEYMVLVAQLEPLGEVPERDVSRFIAKELTDTLEKNISFSKIRIRQYPAVLTSDEQAQAAAEANNATVVLWGNYNADRIALEVQIGVTTAFPHLAIERETLERTANVPVRLTSELDETVAPQVLGVLSVLQGSDGNIYEYMRTMAVMSEIMGGATAEPYGNGVAAHVHRGLATLYDDPEHARQEIEAARQGDPANPFLEALLATLDLLQDNTGDATRGIETTARLAADWVVPYYLQANATNSVEEKIAAYSAIIERQPDDWFPVFYRGALYFLLGDGENTISDLQQSIDMGANANYPYALLALTYLNLGRFEDGQAMIFSILESESDEFKDPTLYNRIVGRTLGPTDPVGPVLTTFMNVTLGRYQEAAESAEIGLQNIGPLTDLYTMQGLAYCNIGELENAEAAFSHALDMVGGENANLSMAFVYLMRADTRLKQGKTDAAEADYATVRQIPGAADTPLIQAFLNGQVDCTNYFGTSTQPPPLSGPIPDDPVDTAPTLPDSTPQIVEPVEPGEYMVLVAQLEQLPGVGQLIAHDLDVTRFIVEDLERTLQEEMAASNVRIREFPNEITSNEEALTAAEATGATVVVWGYHDMEQIELYVQVGSLAAFPHIPFERDTVERTANVRVKLTDARQETIAPQVIGVINILTIADGDEMEFFYTLAIIDTLTDLLAANADLTGVDPDGISVAAHLHRGLMAYPEDGTQTLQEFTAAVEQDHTNPITYVYRAIGHLRNDDEDGFTTDYETAVRLAGSLDWSTLIALRPIADGDYEAAQQLVEDLVAARPDDWYAYHSRGLYYYYGQGDLDQARADFEQAITLGPTTTLPYFPAALIAMREGRITDVQAYAQAVLTGFVDPEIDNRAAQAVYGDEAVDFTGTLISAGTNLILGQDDAAIQELDRILSPSEEITDFLEFIKATGQALPAADLYLLQGLAYCDRGDYADAESVYSTALELDPDFALLYVLRGEVRQQQGDTDGAAEDFATAQEYSLAPEFAAWIAAAEAGEWDCQNFFFYTPPDLPTG